MKRTRLLALLAAGGLVAAAWLGFRQDPGSVEAAADSTEAVEEIPVLVEGVAEEAEDTEDSAERQDPSEEAEADASEGESDNGEALDEGPAEIATDFGVDDNTIRIGLSADQSGGLAGLVQPIIDAQIAYFDQVNETGGIGGREIEVVVLDSALDVPTQLDNYAELAEQSAEGVVLISHSTGFAPTSAITDELANDDLIAVPLSWNSSWSAGSSGARVFELHTNYCIEAMNGVEFLAQQSSVAVPTIAILTLDGEYGRDAAAGAKIAAQALGLELVFDGEAQIIGGGEDLSAITRQLVAADPDIVWIASGAEELAQILNGSASQGLDALWSGNLPSYHPALLGTDARDSLESFYFPSAYTALWGTNDSAGMRNVIAELSERLADGTYADADAYILGWTQAIFAETVLRHAAENGDMTRAGIATAANEVTVDFQGLAPTQSWTGAPNESVVRGSYLYRIDAAAATLDTAITESGSAGYVLLEENFVGEVAASHEFTEPCNFG